MNYDREDAGRVQDATEAMIRMREPRSGPHPDPLKDTTDLQGRMHGLADRLDDASERCAARASKYAKGTDVTSDLTQDLLTRAYVYQECAGLIREAIR